MPRKPRIDLPGFHHVINRGINRENIFLCDADKEEFLQILNTAREIYNLTVHSFCVLDNHYHLLIETQHDNLSLAIRYVNSQYAVYFNKRMGRSGHLWQGRFKSWYIHSDDYLWLLIRYIEMNPVKIGLSEAVGEYPFSSSYFMTHSLKSDLLTSSLLFDKDMHDWLSPLNEKDIAALDSFASIRHEKNGDSIRQYRRRLICNYFTSPKIAERNESIYSAFVDGHTQSSIADYLNLSVAAVSRIVFNERAKRELFTEIQRRGLFWSYASDVEYDVKKAGLLVETVLKYADMDDIRAAVMLYGIRNVRQVWNARLKSDSRFKKLNYFLARVLFKMDVEVDYFDNVSNPRTEKFRLLAG